MPPTRRVPAADLPRRRKPEFRGPVGSLTASSAEVARRDLAGQVLATPWLDWAARLVPAVAAEAVIAWLDAGQPSPGQAAGRIGQAIPALSGQPSR